MDLRYERTKRNQTEIKRKYENRKIFQIPNKFKTKTQMKKQKLCPMFSQAQINMNTRMCYDELKNNWN